QLEQHRADLKADAAGNSWNPIAHWFDEKAIADAEEKIKELKQKLGMAASTETTATPAAPTAPSAPGASGSLPAFGNLTSSTALQEFRARLAEMEGSWKGTNTAMLAEAVKMWQQEVSTAKLSATEILEARQGLGNAQKALRNAELEDARKEAQQKQQLDKEATDTALEGKKADFEVEVAAGKITATQKIDALKEFATQEHQLDLDALNHEIQT